MADTKTYLKVPYRGSTIRMTPFNGGHLTALTMAQQMRDDRRKINVVLRILNGMLGEDGYEQVTNDFVDGAVQVSDLLTLVEDAVKATAAYHQAKGPDALQDALDREEARQTEPMSSE
jgi:hypothetical protein